MKRPLLSLSVSALALAASTAFAQETFFGVLDDDYVFGNGVLIQGVTSAAEGEASILLEGAGSMTVSSAAGGGFPRVVIYGETTLKSTRTFSAEELNKTTWSGQFDAPSSGVKPGFFDINDPGAGFADDYEATDAFGIGLANEEFSFAPAADVVFPTGEQEGQKLYVATEGSDATWTVKTDLFCIVSQGLCALPLDAMNKIALIKEKFENCPVQNIANGTVGGTPSCIYSCNSGFQLNEEANGCEAVVSNEDFENSFEENTSETTTNQEQALFENQIVAPTKEYEFPPGHFRYRASGEKFYRYLDETGLAATYDEEGKVDPNSELGVARLNNTSYLSRNPRTAEEQLTAQATASSAASQAADDESFMSYLISMRNYFGSGAQENYYTALSAEGGEGGDSEGGEGESATEGELSGGGEEGGEFLSSGPTLPSTGPGIFVTIAVVGFALMMFGARRS